MQNNNSKINTVLLVILVILAGFCAWKLIDNDTEVDDDDAIVSVGMTQTKDNADELDYQPTTQNNANQDTGQTSLGVQYYVTTEVPESKIRVNYPFTVSAGLPGSNVYEFNSGQFSEGVKYYATPVTTPTANNGSVLTYQGTETFGSNIYSVYTSSSIIGMKYYYIKNTNVGLLFSSSQLSGLNAVDLAYVELL